MKKLAEFSVRHPIAVSMIILAVLLLGFISFRRLGVDLFPDLSNPRIFVELKAGERPPQEIEEQFVDQIESLAIRQKNVTQVSSVSRVGSAQIIVEYKWNSDMDEAFLNLQKAIDSYNQNTDIDELNITQHDPNSAPIVSLGLSHPEIQDMDELRRIADNYIRNELVRLEGIAEVEISGHEEKEVVIETDGYLLEAYKLTQEEIANRISNLNRNVSGGSIEEMGKKYIIKGVSVFQSLEDFENMILTYADAGGQTDASGEQSQSNLVPILLKDIATVKYQNKDPESIVRINGKRCLALDVYKETKFNTVQAANSLLTALRKINAALPGYEIAVIQNQGEFITGAINEVKQTALFGILLAVLVLYLFLRRVGATAIISIAIPISVVATFNLMFFNGLTLNIMTLGGLALGAGMLVDNAIVVVENILRNLESGLSAREASIIGTKQVGGAITASTITTIVVFLPIVYLHGAAGELFKDQAWTVAFSLLSSLVVAVLVIPMLGSRFLDKPPSGPGARSIRFSWYSGVLSGVLNKRWLTIWCAVALVLVAALLIPVVGSEFIPRIDSNEFSVELRLAEGTKLSRTESAVESIENIIQSALPGQIGTIYSRVGPSSGMAGDESTIFQDENTAVMKIILKEDRNLPSEEVISTISGLLSGIPDMEAQFVQDQTALQTILGTESTPIVVEIKGDALDQLEILTEQVKQKLLTVKDLFNVETSFEEGRPEVEIVVDRLRAGLSEIGVNEITSQLKDQLMGKEAGLWEHDGESRDITLKLPEVGINQLEDIYLAGGKRNVRLDEIADIRMGSAPREINRKNQIRTGIVTAHYRKGKPFDHVIHQIEESLADIDFPPGYKMEITGEEQKRKDSFQNLKFALILSIILVYMVLASQFESLIHPFTILLTIPLAGVGAVLIFLILGRSLNIMAYIGIIMLVGIAVNDSIILVDAINQLKRQGLSRADAIIGAGQRRIRPIIMTSITTILALLPLTFGFGEGASLRSPMALAVIGGLVTSTILTLFVIPCVYFVLDQLRGEST